MLSPDDPAMLDREPPCPTLGAPRPDSASETWVLQGDAATQTGFSVSAIRKWRRMGVVAERRVAAGGDLSRVEVRLEDVLARAAQQPPRRPLGVAAAGSEPAAPSGSIIIGIDDLEALFERMVRAERRAEVAEAELQTMQVQARYTLGQLAELRRQLRTNGGPTATAAGPGEPVPGASNGDDDMNVWPTATATAPAPAPVRAEPAAPPRPGPGPEREARVLRTRTGTGTGTGPAPAGPRPSPRPAAPAPVAPVTTPPPTPSPTRPDAPDPRSDVTVLADRLRRVYGRLDDYRRQPTISPDQERQRQQELAEYDRALLDLCAALGMRTGLGPGAPVTVDARANLTRGLARAGFDVRASGEPAAKRRPRLAPPHPRG